MKAEIKTLSWDSDFFGKKIGEVTIDNAAILEPSKNLDLIVVKQNKHSEISIKNFEKTFQETKVIFAKDLVVLNIIDDSIISDTDETNLGWEDFQSLAYESGKMSRFLLDQNFGEEKFKKLYNEWIINSLNKKFAIKVFYILQENKPVAFVTLQQSGDIGKIGLIATLPDFQGKGYGKKLLQFAENFCIENGLVQMEIPTQEENQQACGFYEKLGYKIKNKLVIKHFWNI